MVYKFHVRSQGVYNIKYIPKEIIWGPWTAKPISWICHSKHCWSIWGKTEVFLAWNQAEAKQE